MTSAVRPFSQACENNKQPIFEHLQQVFAEVGSVLEIGSGTGQHAVFFAPRMPHLTWQPSDLAENLPGIRAWIQTGQAANLKLPIELDVTWDAWPVDRVDGIFSANSLHIMSWPSVGRLFEGVGRTLKPGGVLCLYGPFNYGGAYTSTSNAQFDQWLKQQNPDSAIRHFEDVNALASDQGLVLCSDHAMPANNRLLVWRRVMTSIDFPKSS